MVGRNTHIFNKILFLICFLSPNIAIAAPRNIHPTDPLYEIWTVPRFRPPKTISEEINKFTRDIMSMRKTCVQYERNKLCASLNEDSIIITFRIRF